MRKKWELDDCKRRVIIRITKEDIIPEVEDYNPTMSEDYLFKNPVTYEARVTGIKIKIYNATGIPPQKLDIIRITISTKRAKLAWVTFSSSKTVNDIFRLSVINGDSSQFNAFPHVPAKAMARYDKIEEILKNLQAQNKALRYQIRLGEDDLIIMVKNHRDFDYVPYRRVTLQMIDPNDEVPEWDLVSKTIPEETNENGKRNAAESPEGKPAPKRQVNIWQVSEFLWAFLEGTQTAANYEDLQWDLEPSQTEENEIEEAEVDPDNVQEDKDSNDQ